MRTGKPICQECKSDDIVIDSTSYWDEEKQEWKHATEFDMAWCQNEECAEEECALIWAGGQS